MKSLTPLHVLTLLLFIDLLQSTNVSSSLTNETDHLSLLKFKESIAADPYGFLNSWNASVHLCKWRGVTCGRRHQRVTTLSLPNAALHGTISPYIGNLSFLRTLTLFNNSFYGNIPQQVDHLFRLRLVNLSLNLLDGKIPTNLTFCPELSIISIGGNRLTGNIPSEIGSLKKLVHFRAAKNNLTGSIPPSLGNLSSLEVLSLAYNNLVGNVPEETGRFQSLSFISVTSNNLSGTIPRSLFNISSMSIFSLSMNKFKGSVPASIGLNMPNLLEVYLGGNELSGQIPSSFSNASLLQKIDLGQNHFEGQVPLTFERLPNLQLLNLESNRLGTNSSKDLEFITFLVNCSNLEILALGVNKFGGVLPNSIGNFSTQLSQLNLGFNQIAGKIPSTIGNLKNLIILSLDNNIFTDVIPASIGKLENLQMLYLNSNRLSGSLPPSLGNLTQLFEVYLTVNELEGRIPLEIGNCQKLQSLEISQNKLTGNVPPQLIGLSSLSALDLSQNSLSGALPPEIGQLKNIKALSFSGNDFTGEIPESIGNCLSLEEFSLRGNLFQGSIPSSLDSLRGLQYLDFSGNNLSGNIPKGLEALPFLVYLNLSFNNLEGKVPKEGVFRNGKVLLDGNTKLCGGVLELQLPACLIKSTKQRTLKGFKLRLTISLVVGCSLLSGVVLALYNRRKSQKKKSLSSALSSINFLPKVSYHTLHQATSGFSTHNQVGAGAFGSVYKGILDEEENTVVAIKVLNLRQKGASKSFVAECNALRLIRHRNLVKIITCCSSTDNNGDDFKALVFDYMSNGSLEEWLQIENQSRRLSLLQRLNIASDVASALCYLHYNCVPQIIHRDMKPSNVLLDDDMVARVSDFGIARLIPSTLDSSENQSSTIGIKGTIGYAAPEYANGGGPSEQGDAYSYGILVLQLFTGRRPTDEMFIDGCNIHTFVKTAIHGRLAHIVDPTLLAGLNETETSTTSNEIESANLSKMNSCVWKCILPVLKIGLACSEESPKNRMSMEEALKELHHIRSAYYGVGIQQRA